MMTSLLFSLTAFCLLYGRIPLPALLAGASLPVPAWALLHRRHRHTHSGFLSIDALAQRSRLRGCSAALKLWFCVACALLCVGANSLWVSLFVAVSMAVFTVGVGGTPVRRYLALLTAPAAFILLGAAAVLVEVSPAPLAPLSVPLGGWYLCVTAHSQQAAAALIFRALGAVSCLYLLSLSTPLHQIIGALRRARVPGVVVELMYLMYRYIFVLLELQSQMRTAASARLGYRDCKTSLHTLCRSSLNLLFLSFRRSSACFSAMEARCYSGEIAFLEPRQHLRAAEAAAALCYVAALLGLWYLVRRLGL